MGETRTAKISVVLPPSLLARLDSYAEVHRWSRSNAALALIERGLDREDQGDDHDVGQDH